MSDKNDYDQEEYDPDQVETNLETQQDEDYEPTQVVAQQEEEDVDYDPTFDPLKNNKPQTEVIPESGIREEDLSELEEDLPKPKGKKKRNKSNQQEGEEGEISKPKKSSKRTLQYEREEEADREADELQKLMRAALDADNNDFKAGVPALNKLSCLPKVVQIMKKTYNHNSLLEIGILEEVRNFLEPYPDGSLPILNIQIELISLLEQMPVTTDFLRNSYLGRIIKFYSICPRITKEVQKQAKSLVSKWTQNIIRQSGSYQKFRMQMRNANQHDRVPENNNKKQMSNKQANLMKTMSKLKRDNRSRR